MKNIFLIVICITVCILFSACKRAEQKEDITTQNEKIEKIMLMMQDTKDRNGPSKVVKAMLDNFDIVPDELVLAFLEYHEEVCRVLTDKFCDDHLVDYTKISKIEIKNNFYFIDISEGIAFFDSDIQAIAAAFRGRVNQDVDKYLTLETRHGGRIADDAALVGTWNDLADDVAQYHKFIAQHFHESIMLGRASGILGLRLGIFIGSTQLDNTPSIENGRLIKEVADSYQYFIDKYGDLELGEDIKQLNDSWKKNKYKDNEDTRALIYSIFFENIVNKYRKPERWGQTNVP